MCQKTCVLANKSPEHDVRQSRVSMVVLLCTGQGTFIVLLFIADAAIMIPGLIADPVTVSSDSYPAAPDFVQPGSGNLHPGLLQQHLWM